ncbi:hypothetical protein SLEP1_g52179 [Rubroshorea leprosula]|nr:hypothetical protein SLEP1_g52179 [Rubroshorea leprosula]
MVVWSLDNRFVLSAIRVRGSSVWVLNPRCWLLNIFAIMLVPLCFLIRFRGA